MTQASGLTNGFKIRGLNADCDRLACQSTIQSTWLVGRRRWPKAPQEVGIAQNELIVLRPYGGAPEIELEGLGGPYGVLVLEKARGGKIVLRNGQKHRIALERDEALVIKTEHWRPPNGPGADVGRV